MCLAIPGKITSIAGVSLVYLYFLVPLMVLVMTPALEGLTPQWAEAAENLGAHRWHYWRFVAGPVLLPNFLGSVLLRYLGERYRQSELYTVEGTQDPVITEVDVTVDTKSGEVETETTVIRESDGKDGKSSP